MNIADAGGKPAPVMMVDYAAFVDSRWHDTVLFVCRILETYSMSELWEMDITRFMKINQKAEKLQEERLKEAERKK